MKKRNLHHSSYKNTPKHSLSQRTSQPPSNAASRSKSQCPRHYFKHELTEQIPTFQPQVKDIPFDMYPSQWQNLLKSKKEHWQELTKDNRQRNLIRAQLKADQERQSMQNITFEPKNKKPYHLSQQVFDRLFKQSETRKVNQILIQKENIEAKQRQIESNLEKGKNNSSYNMINKEKFDLEPLYLRLQKVVQKQMIHRKMIAQKQGSCSFQPIINKKSVEMVANKKQKIASIVDRLIDDFKNRENKVNILRQKFNKQLDTTLTFKPTINNFMPLEPSILNISSKKKQIQEFTYQPQLNSKSLLIAREQRLEQSKQDMINRLHSAPQAKLSEKISQIQNQMYMQCSFNPEINLISKQIPSCQFTKKHHCQTPVKEEPTHRPSINQVSKTMTKTKKNRSIDNFKQKNKIKAQNYLKRTEYDQLKECTFRPNILSTSDSKNSSKMTNIHNISGFQSYMKNVQKAQEQSKNRRILQEKLFNLQKSYDRRHQKIQKSILTQI